MEKIASQNTFEQNNTYLKYDRGSHSAQICLDLGKTAMHFACIDRVPRYDNGERENDAEHSYMLALVAPELSESLELPLNSGLITQYAIVHDLIELKTGDKATFLFDKHHQAQKEAEEHAALVELIHDLPPYTATMLLRYESQEDPEARFVRYVDKLLPIVIDVIGQGERVMREDYGVTSQEALAKCHDSLHERLVEKFNGEFPELDTAHALLCELFETMFTSSKRQ